jgi:hypothetical protein
MPQSSLYVDTGWTDHNVYSVNNQTMEDTFSEKRAEMTREIWLVGTTRLRRAPYVDSAYYSIYSVYSVWSNLLRTT